jgi:hypothetical protein
VVISSVLFFQYGSKIFSTLAACSSPDEYKLYAGVQYFCFQRIGGKLLCKKKSRLNNITSFVPGTIDGIITRRVLLPAYFYGFELMDTR